MRIYLIPAGGGSAVELGPVTDFARGTVLVKSYDKRLAEMYAEPDPAAVLAALTQGDPLRVYEGSTVRADLDGKTYSFDGSDDWPLFGG